MKTKSLPYLSAILLMSFLIIFSPKTVFADSSETASTIRLIHYEGDVDVEGADGSTPAVMEGMRFNSGEALVTGKNSTASVSLDESKILSMAENSRIEFSQKGKKLKLTLKEGELFLDVKEKLGPDETLDIQTSTMAVGIRGTIVSASDRAAEDTPTGRNVDFKVLEGSTEVSWIDWAGSNQTTIVNAGEMLSITDSDGDGRTETEPVPKEMIGQDLTEFIKKLILQDPSVSARVQNACGVLSNEDELFPADGDWTWDQPVTFVAQSASKLYDGLPLTRPGDVLVNGLPAGMSFQASANGSQTDAGIGSNPIASYAIFNSSGEDVTAHFTGIDTVAGNLTVDPAPLTVWTASASKVYDGTPLTAPEAQIRTVPGYQAGEPLWRDTAYVGNASAGSEVLYGVCGTTWVHGTNPLTGEIREIELPAGKKMSVYLSDENGEQSIEFRIEDMTEEDIPEELLHLYADNEDLLEQACRDTGWDIEIIRKKIAELQDDGGSKIEKSGLAISESSSDRLMQDSTNVRIHIDTQITNYNGRALGNQEAHYTGVHIDDSIKIRATGSQTPAGQSYNTYEIDWGNANPNNYVFNEELGTLTVTPASLKVTTGSAEKEYDGKPLTNEEASLTGLVNGETANVTATGTVTEVGSTVNTYTIDWGTADQKNYSITEELGLLKITAAQEPEPTYDDPVTLTAATAEKVYDGITLTGGTVTAEGLPDGFTVTAKTNGAQTDAGSSNNEVSEYTIFDGAGKDVTAQFTNITTVKGTLTVTPAPLTVTTGSAEKTYDGKPLTSVETSITGLVNGETAEVSASGIQTDAGSAENTYTIAWGTAGAENYKITEQLGTLTVKPLPIEFTLYCYDETYYGYPVVPEGMSGIYPDLSKEVEIEEYEYFLDEEEITTGRAYVFNLIGGGQVRMSVDGPVDAGEYTITPETEFTAGKAGNYNISFSGNTMVIEPAPLTITASASRPYDGTPLKGSDAIKVTGLADGENITVTATAEITDAGTAENPYTIDWGTTNKENYQFTDETEEVGTLEVTKIPLTLTPTYTANSSTGTTFMFTGLDLTVTSGGSETPVVTPSWNAWTDYTVIANKGNVSVQNNGGNTRWTVSVPGDEFTVQLMCYAYTEGDSEYVGIFCSAIGEIRNHSITSNDAKGFPIVYSLENTPPDDGNSDGNNSTSGKTSLSMQRKDSKALQDSKEDLESAVKEETGEASADPEKDGTEEGAPEEGVTEEDVKKDTVDKSEGEAETSGKTDDAAADEGESADKEVSEESGSDQKTEEKEDKPKTDSSGSQGDKKNDEEQLEAEPGKTDKGSPKPEHGAEEASGQSEGAV